MGLLLHQLWRRTLSAAAATTTTTTSIRWHPRGSVRRINSLALTVYFKQPKFGMQDYDMLSRATAFLLGIGEPESKANDDDDASGPYSHLETSERRRYLREFRNVKKYSDAGVSKTGRSLFEMSWLEFVPKEVRPRVHVVCSSHVVAPFLWKDYYPQHWLAQVTREHCKYVVEVFDSERPDKSLAEIELDSNPYHHPEGRDIALLHFREEQAALKTLKELGVNILYLRHPERLYEKGEELLFDGFLVAEAPKDSNNSIGTPSSLSGTTTTSTSRQADIRVFSHHPIRGNLSYHTENRFFATTPEPLPEGLCGAPVIDSEGDLCGVVEGIVPVDFKNKNLAGSAAFLPSHTVNAFVDYIERALVKQMMPEGLFKLVATTKKTNSAMGGGIFKKDPKTGTYSVPTTFEDAYNETIAQLKTKYTDAEFKAVMKIIEKEREQVLEIFNKEGGDLDEIIGRVRAQTLEMRALIHDQFKKEKMEESRQKEDDSGNDGGKQKKPQN